MKQQLDTRSTAAHPTLQESAVCILNTASSTGTHTAHPALQESAVCTLNTASSTATHTATTDVEVKKSIS